jgi:hypothetical protein
VVKEDKDDRYGSEAIESGFIFQIIRSGNENDTSGACGDAPSSELLRAKTEKLLQNCDASSRRKFCSGFDRTVNGKPDEGGLKNAGRN